MKKFIKKYVPPVTAVAVILAVLAAAALVLSILFTPVADFLAETVTVAFRITVSVFTNFLPFSVFEMLLVLAVPLIILILFLLFRKIRTKEQAVRFLFGVVAIPAFIFSGFVFSLGIPYHTTRLDKKMALTDTSVSADTLYATSLILRDEVNRLARELSLSAEHESKSPMSMSELSENLTEAYGVFEDDYGFPFNFYTRAKPMLFDEVMSRAHLLGIYTFFTGESNINDGYPDYSTVNTVAHEFAHQRGIMREDEANFMAFAVCIRSTDPYVNYCGYLNMYEYVITALYDTNRDLYREVHRGLCDEAFADIRAYNEKSREYRDSKLGETVGSVNDAYLQINGTEGSISYSLCVRLAVAYYHS